MNLGPAINIGLGLIMTFATMALIVTAINEAIARIRNIRSNNLRDGIKALLNDPTLTGLASKVMEHGAANPMMTPWKPQPSGPTHIDAKQFASALISVVQDDDPLRPLAVSLDKIPDPQIKAVLQGAFAKVDGDVERFHKEVADWFDTAMAGMSEAYKQDAQFLAFVVAMILALVLNVDAFAIAKAIWAHPTIVSQVPTLDQAAGKGMADFTQLMAAGYPLGWGEAESEAFSKLTGWATVLWCLSKFFGCAFTAGAAMMGAPFWFDMLGKARSAIQPVKP